MYYSAKATINRPDISSAAADSIAIGLQQVCQSIVGVVREHLARDRAPYLLALDGYVGIEWDPIISNIQTLLEEVELEAEVIDVSSCLKDPPEIDKMLDPLLNHDHDFGYVFEGDLEQFFDTLRLQQLKEKLTACLAESKRKAVVCYGSGAAVSALRELYNRVYYFDLTREELFNRSEERQVFLPVPGRHSKPVHQSLRRYYYVDSQALDRHKRSILACADGYVDSNDTDELKLVPRDAYEELLCAIAQAPIAIKMLYYPVTWGGSWQKELKELPRTMENSGQGFLVANENSLMIAVDGASLEIPFQNLMWAEAPRILGQTAFEVAQGNFPLTYWYDDQIAGWHMAIQVHPDAAYAREHFNEPMQQDESYYILHTESEAKTYLGLTQEADPEDLRRRAAESESKGIPFDFDKYVNSIPTEPGDFLLIPAGIIHASGRNQVVVEIDWVITAYTPGYTFHVYDYLRPDLDGSMRPIHIDHSFSALKDRRTEWVLKNLKQEPRLVREGEGWAEYVLGQRDDMLFEVRRLEFESCIHDETEEQRTFHALTLVEGESVHIQSQEHPGTRYKLDYPDTLLIPACMGKYTIANPGSTPCRVVKAMVS